MRVSLISAALVAALVGYGSTIALVLTAAAAIGATPVQTTSWVLAVSVAKAIGSASLSVWTRAPVVLAWSTPGAALIAATTNITMPEAVGAFCFAGVLILLTAAIRPLGRAIAQLPDGIAAAMLAGVLLPFCLQGMRAVESAPQLILPMVVIFALVRLGNPALAVLAALATGVVITFVTGAAQWPDLVVSAPSLVFVLPEFSPGVLIGLGLPLYLVTMASQNLPGFAVLRAAGYEAPVTRALGVTGGLSVLAALFGAHTINMAAITAAICLGEDVHPDPNQRWKVGVAYGVAWIGLGLFSPTILALLQALPPEVMTGLVALALLGPLMGALSGAFVPTNTRFAATMTLAVTGSGVAILGVGAAFWGLMVGLAAFGLERLARRP